MEISGTVLRHASTVHGARSDSLGFHRRLASVGLNGGIGGIRVPARVRSDSVFSDDGHLNYYQGSIIRCGGRDKQKGSAVLTNKKKMKVLKGLYEGLSMASELGFSLDSEKVDFLEEAQGKTTSDAAEVLLKQLERLKAEKKELKRLKKEEKAKLKTARMKASPDCDSESSSSSSSESSDSECEEMVDMRSLRASTAIAPAPAEQVQSTIVDVAVLSPPSPSSLPQGRTSNESICELGVRYAKEMSISSDSNISSIKVGPKLDDILTIPVPQKRIEVCMGNKCKKSGAPALLEEFERVVGSEGTVVGCKCMGKCKNGPNVRVQNSVGEGLSEGLINDSVMVPANPLYIGVSLEDVDVIVARMLGENSSNSDSASAAAP